MASLNKILTVYISVSLHCLSTETVLDNYNIIKCVRSKFTKCEAKYQYKIHMGQMTASEMWFLNAKINLTNKLQASQYWHVILYRLLNMFTYYVVALLSQCNYLVDTSHFVSSPRVDMTRLLVRINRNTFNWNERSSGLWRCEVFWYDTNVQRNMLPPYSGWRWKQHESLKRWYRTTTLHDVTAPKMDEIRTSETFVSYHNTTRRHNPGDST
jgi:hypothetical protein